MSIKIRTELNCLVQSHSFLFCLPGLTSAAVTICAWFWPWDSTKVTRTLNFRQVMSAVRPVLWIKQRSALCWPEKKLLFWIRHNWYFHVCTQIFLQVGLKVAFHHCFQSSQFSIQLASSLCYELLCPSWAYPQMLLWDVLVTVAHVLMPSMLARSFWCLWQCPASLILVAATLSLTLQIPSYWLLLVTCWAFCRIEHRYFTVKAVAVAYLIRASFLQQPVFYIHVKCKEQQCIKMQSFNFISFTAQHHLELDL